MRPSPPRSGPRRLVRRHRCPVRSAWPRTRRPPPSTTAWCSSAGARSGCSGSPSGPAGSSRAGEQGEPVGSGRAPGLLARRLVSAGAFAPITGRGPYGRSDVTVVVPVRDRPAQLDRLLARLEGLRCLVVDDASRDAAATSEICARHGAQFVGLTHERRSGRGTEPRAGAGRDAGGGVRRLRLSCHPRIGWNHCWLISKIPSWPRSRRASCRQPRDASAVVARYEAVRSSLDRGLEAGPVRPGSVVPFVPSAVFVVRTEVVDGHELFDPQLRSGEDVDLEWRLVAAGWDVRYEPGIVVAHDGAATVRRLPRPTVLLRHFGRPTRPPARRRHGAGPGLGLVGRASGCSASCGDRGWPWPRRPRPSSCWPSGCAASSATRSRWRRRSPAAGRRGPQCLRWAAMARVWSPLLVLGFSPAARGAWPDGPAPARAERPSPRSRAASTPAATSGSTWRTMSPTGPESGRVASERARPCRCCPGDLAFTHLVFAGPPRRTRPS